MRCCDVENLVYNGRRMEPAAPHILAQVIRHFLQSMEPRRGRRLCSRYDASGKGERFLRIRYWRWDTCTDVHPIESRAWTTGLQSQTKCRA